MRIVLWGTYNSDLPRNRIMIHGLRQCGHEVIELHYDVWAGIDDKSQFKGLARKTKLTLRWLCSYPKLIWNYLRVGKHDAVIVCYLGHVDVLVLRPFAILRRTPVIWDAYVSLYSTVVEDRKMIGRFSPIAWLIYVWEWAACRAAHMVVLDTNSHTQYFADRYHIPPKRLGWAWVGAEQEHFSPGPPRDQQENLAVLFYGSLIPLHGIETIVKAARLTRDAPIKWTIIGRGQQASFLSQLLADEPLPKLEHLTWVSFQELQSWLHRTDVCLGIFGNSDKASRVIPNKVFQSLCTGTPVITRDSPAIRELAAEDTPGVYLVPAEDPVALADVLRRIVREGTAAPDLAKTIVSDAIGKQFSKVIQRTLENKSSP